MLNFITLKITFEIIYQMFGNSLWHHNVNRKILVKLIILWFRQLFSKKKNGDDKQSVSGPVQLNFLPRSAVLTQYIYILESLRNTVYTHSHRCSKPVWLPRCHTCDCGSNFPARFSHFPAQLLPSVRFRWSRLPFTFHRRDILYLMEVKYLQYLWIYSFHYLILAWDKAFLETNCLLSFSWG